LIWPRFAIAVKVSGVVLVAKKKEEDTKKGNFSQVAHTAHIDLYVQPDELATAMMMRQCMQIC